MAPVHPPGHAEACSRSENRHRSGVACALLQHHLLLGIEMGQAVDQNGEIVHQFQLVHGRGLGQGPLLQLPGEVGDPGAVVAHRPCHGDAAMRGYCDALRPVVEEGLEHRFQRWPFAGCETVLMQNLEA